MCEDPQRRPHPAYVSQSRIPTWKDSSFLGRLIGFRPAGILVWCSTRVSAFRAPTHVDTTCSLVHDVPEPCYAT